VGSRLPSGQVRDVALDATLRAAAARGSVNPEGNPAVALSAEDMRVKVRRRRTGTAALFLVDSSGSMGVNQRMAATKGVILSLLNDAYQRRDRVGLIMFRGREALPVLPFTSSVELAEQRLAALPTGGRTPLAAGLLLAQRMFIEEERRHPKMNRLLVLISDGKANVASQGDDPAAELQAICRTWRPKDARRVVIDPESGLVRFGRARLLAEWLQAEYLRMDEITAAGATGAVSIILKRSAV